MTPWDGKTERRSDPTDHDNLIRVITILAEHVKNFDQHVIEDKKNFESLSNKLWSHARYIYIGIGMLAVIQVILKIHI